MVFGGNPSGDFVSPDVPNPKFNPRSNVVQQKKVFIEPSMRWWDVLNHYLNGLELYGFADDNETFSLISTLQPAVDKEKRVAHYDHVLFLEARLKAAVGLYRQYKSLPQNEIQCAAYRTETVAGIATWLHSLPDGPK